MWENGFVEEVRHLEARGLRSARTAGAALGYQQVLAFLAGELTEAQAKEQTIRATRRFARRQDSWFRKDPRITWVAWDDEHRADGRWPNRTCVGSGAQHHPHGQGERAVRTRSE